MQHIAQQKVNGNLRFSNILGSDVEGGWVNVNGNDMLCAEQCSTNAKYTTTTAKICHEASINVAFGLRSK